jgi:hypothetical protein
MGFAPRALLAGGLGFAAALLAACGGSSGLLSGSQANNLNASLDQLSNAVDAGQCGAAANAVTTFSNAVVDLPPSVSATLTHNLEQGASTVAQLAAKDCQTASSTTSSTTTSSSTTTTSTPTSTSTTTSTPTTTTSTPTTTTSTTATTQTGSGTTSTDSGSGGAGLGGSGGGGSGGGGTGGSGTGGGNPQ